MHFRRPRQGLCVEIYGFRIIVVVWLFAVTVAEPGFPVVGEWHQPFFVPYFQKKFPELEHLGNHGFKFSFRQIFCQISGFLIRHLT